MSEWENKGEFLGIDINVTKDGTPRTPEEIREALSRFNTVHLLRTVGVFADQLYFKATKDLMTADSLAYIARAAIEAGSDQRQDIATEADVRRIAGMYHNLRENHARDNYEAIRILLRMGYAQFAHQPHPAHLIARTWYLYLHLWTQVKEAASFQIEEQLLDLIGAPYHKALGIGLAYWGNSRKGYTQPYREDAQAGLGPKYRSTPEEARRIFDWMSCTYDDIRSLQSDQAAKYGLSPFIVTPLVKPDEVPQGADVDVRVVPFPSFVLEKLTSGAFYGLADRHNRGGRDNEFRMRFGYVFEAYVGELLKAGSGNAIVLREFTYGGKHVAKKSPDWMVVEGSTVLVVEVKASALSLATKMSGSVTKAKEDLAGNLAKGVQQLLDFRDDILAGRTENEALSNAKEIQLLAVTHDNVPWANFIFPQLIENGSEVQFASVEELELLQTYCWHQSPFRVLRDKTSGTHTARQDVGSYVRDFHGPGLPRHPMLSVICDNLMRDMGVTVPPR